MSEIDHIFPNAPHRIEDIIVFLNDHWRNGWIHGGGAETGWPLFKMGQNIARNQEFFVYESEAAAASWKSDGRTDDNANRMVHVLWDADEVTFVCEDDALWAEAESYLEAKRLDRHLTEQLRVKIQEAHDREVWQAIRKAVAGWKDGTLNTHDTKALAKLVGCELEAPKFLDALLEHLDSLDL